LLKNNFGDDFFWIGLDDVGDVADRTWDIGEKLYEGVGSMYSAKEGSCAILSRSKSGEWSTDFCENLHPAICERRADLRSDNNDKHSSTILSHKSRDVNTVSDILESSLQSSTVKVMAEFTVCSVSDAQSASTSFYVDFPSVPSYSAISLPFAFSSLATTYSIEYHLDTYPIDIRISTDQSDALCLDVWIGSPLMCRGCV
jgi:hypothetical protein